MDQGLPIVIIGGPGEGESSTIIEYHGRTRRATVEFESSVDHGSKYAIMHDKGLGMGYKVCVLTNISNQMTNCFDNKGMHIQVCYN